MILVCVSIIALLNWRRSAEDETTANTDDEMVDIMGVVMRARLRGENDTLDGYTMIDR